jgi:ABC-type lipoprotein release transport system permease subunit
VRKVYRRDAEEITVLDGINLQVPPGEFVAIAFAVVMGLVGGLLPALRAARLPITSALRET